LQRLLVATFFAFGLLLLFDTLSLSSDRTPIIASGSSVNNTTTITNDSLTERANNTLTGVNETAAQTLAAINKSAAQTLAAINQTAAQRVNITEEARQAVVQQAKEAFTDLPGSIAGMLAAAIILVIAIPVIADLLLAHYRQQKQKTSNGPSGMPGLYRSVMALGLIAVVSIVVVYLIALVAFNITIRSEAVDALINVLQNLSTILGTALAAVIAFYFGIRGVENATERAFTAAGLKTKGEGIQTIPPKVTGRYPADGQNNISETSPIVVSFNKAMDGSTITKDTFIVRKEGTDRSIEAEEIKLVENQAIFKPRDNLEKHTEYIVKLTREVKDESGNKMLSDEEWSFRTVE